MVMEILILSIASLLTICTLLYAFSDILSSSGVASFLGVVVKLFHCFLVPIVDYAMYCVFIIVDSGFSLAERVIDALTAVMLFFGVGILILESVFEVRLFRKKTPYWNIQNTSQATNIVYLVFKSVFISFG